MHSPRNEFSTPSRTGHHLSFRPDLLVPRTPGVCLCACVSTTRRCHTTYHHRVITGRACEWWVMRDRTYLHRNQNVRGRRRYCADGRAHARGGLKMSETVRTFDSIYLTSV